MQTIAGIHYNFSLPIEFWQALVGIKDAESGKDEISAGYFRLIRNYYRLVGLSPIYLAPRLQFVVLFCMEMPGIFLLRRQLKEPIIALMPHRYE